MRNWTSEDIKNLRSKYKLSQPAFGSLLGVTGNYIYLLEKGERIPSNTLRLLLDCVENQKRGEVKKHGKRDLQKR